MQTHSRSHRSRGQKGRLDNTRKERRLVRN
uniref:Uncharacterized protein n=1 Tax=Anguilla anguilla TaxID=7936 RepID=A0A0E9R1Y6_ANGAN